MRRSLRSSDRAAAGQPAGRSAASAAAAPTHPQPARPRTTRARAAAVEEAPAAAAPGALPTKASALIIGGGPSGLAAALVLSARGWTDVVVLERRDTVNYADTDR
jgi:threonine dehydrogenase-like Zn-dependent dehydrogenase